MRDEVLEAVQRLQPVADQAGLTLAQLAIAWTLQNENVASAIVGASRPSWCPSATRTLTGFAALRRRFGAGGRYGRGARRSTMSKSLVII
ncbi:hypothetical protein HP467_00015, partial [Curtobacterium albidum]